MSNVSTVTTKLVALLVPLALLAGCGGTRTVVTTVTTPASAARLTKAQLIARVNGECRAGFGAADAAYDRRIKARGIGRATTPAKARNLAPVIRSYMSDWRVVIDRMRALRPPAADQAVYARFIVLWDRITSNIDSLADALAAGDLSRVERLKDDLGGDVLLAERNGIARAYGFRACVRS